MLSVENEHQWLYVVPVLVNRKTQRCFRIVKHCRTIEQNQSSISRTIELRCGLTTKKKFLLVSSSGRPLEAENQTTLLGTRFRNVFEDRLNLLVFKLLSSV